MKYLKIPFLYVFSLVSTKNVDGYHIKTTPEQDEIISATFKQISETTYNLFFNNCATAVQESMAAANIPVDVQRQNISTADFEPFNLTFLPAAVYNSIVLANPKGRHVYKTK